MPGIKLLKVKALFKNYISIKSSSQVDQKRNSSDFCFKNVQILVLEILRVVLALYFSLLR